MIDLHMHTTNSDGSDTPEELLKKCEELKLDYISITDHDTCASYDEIKENNLDNLFTGKIITGCELTTIYKGRTIEILGYGVKTNIISNWCTNFYTKEKENKRKEYCINNAISNLAKLGIYIDKNELDKNCAYSLAIYKKLIIKMNKRYIRMIDIVVIVSLTNFAIAKLGGKYGT